MTSWHKIFHELSFYLLETMNFYWYSQNWNRQIDRLTDQQTNRPSYRDAMMHIVSLVYFLTYLLKNIEFPWFWQKHHGPTDGRTNGPTDPLIEMRGRPWIIVAIALGRAAIHVEAAAGCKSGSIANPVQRSSESPLENEFCSQRKTNLTNRIEKACACTFFIVQ